MEEDGGLVPNGPPLVKPRVMDESLTLPMMSVSIATSVWLSSMLSMCVSTSPGDTCHKKSVLGSSAQSPWRGRHRGRHLKGLLTVSVLPYLCDWRPIRRNQVVRLDIVRSLLNVHSQADAEETFLSLLRPARETHALRSGAKRSRGAALKKQFEVGVCAVIDRSDPHRLLQHEWTSVARARHPRPAAALGGIAIQDEMLCLEARRARRCRGRRRLARGGEPRAVGRQAAPPLIPCANRNS